MKNFSILIFIMMIALLSVTCDLNAQNPTKVNAKSIPGWMYHNLGSFASDPAASETTATFRPGGYPLSSITYSVADTCRDTIYVEEMLDDATWGVIATKAINCTDYLTPTVYEEVLRDGDTDILDTVRGYVRLRHNRASAGNGTAGSYPTITLTLNFKP